MADVYFPVTAFYAGFAPQPSQNIYGDVLFIPLGAIPAGHVPGSVPATVWGGVLFGLDGAPEVQLLAGTDLSYLVSFKNFVVVPPNFLFAAPSDATPVDLITVARLT